MYCMSFQGRRKSLNFLCIYSVKNKDKLPTKQRQKDRVHTIFDVEAWILQIIFTWKGDICDKNRRKLQGKLQ